MKFLFTAATALAMSGSALAYQTYPTHTTHSTTATQKTPVAVSTDPVGVSIDPIGVSIDPDVALVAPTSWTVEQRALWEEQMDYHPDWTPAQVAAFEAMMSLPPASWTAEQQALYAAHLGHVPAGWTAEQRATFSSMVDPIRTPWMSAKQTAAVDYGPAPIDTTTATTTYAAAPASGPVVEPSNADPEHDARGIAVISAPAFVPAGYNGIPATAVGGPVEGDDASYPACSATVTDNCIQLYERGVRASQNDDTSAKTMTAVGGPYAPVGEDEVGDNTKEDDALDVDVRPDGDIDVDGDLDNDGDNDLE